MDFSRRDFLKVGTFAGLAAASIGLVACGSNNANTDSESKSDSGLDLLPAKLGIGEALAKLKLGLLRLRTTTRNVASMQMFSKLLQAQTRWSPTTISTFRG